MLYLCILVICLKMFHFQLTLLFLSLREHAVLAGWSCRPLEVRETLPQQFSLPGSAHQACVPGPGLQNQVLGAATDAQCGL